MKYFLSLYIDTDAELQDGRAAAEALHECIPAALFGEGAVARVHDVTFSELLDGALC